MRHAENYNNHRKYSEQDLMEVAEMKAQEAEMEAQDHTAAEERRQMINKGLRKYGFSEDGAKLVSGLIAKGWDIMDNSCLEVAVSTGKIKFETAEKKAAAFRAFDYYWKE